METSSIIKGCEAMQKLDVNVEASIFVQDFIWRMDNTTQAEVKAAIKAVLVKRANEIQQEVKKLANQ